MRPPITSLVIQAWKEQGRPKPWKTFSSTPPPSDSESDESFPLDGGSHGLRGSAWTVSRSSSTSDGSHWSGLQASNGVSWGEAAAGAPRPQRVVHRGDASVPRASSRGVVPRSVSMDESLNVEARQRRRVADLPPKNRVPHLPVYPRPRHHLETGDVGGAGDSQIPAPPHRRLSRSVSHHDHLATRPPPGPLTRSVSIDADLRAPSPALHGPHPAAQTPLMADDCGAAGGCPLRLETLRLRRSQSLDDGISAVLLKSPRHRRRVCLEQVRLAEARAQGERSISDTVAETAVPLDEPPEDAEEPSSRPPLPTIASQQMFEDTLLQLQ